MTKKLIRQTELQLDIEDIQDCDTVFGIYDSSIDGSDLECLAIASECVTDFDLEIFDENDNYLGNTIVNVQFAVDMYVIIDLASMIIKSFKPLSVKLFNFSAVSKHREAAAKSFKQIIKDYYDSSSTHNSADLNVTLKEGDTFYML